VNRVVKRYLLNMSADFTMRFYIPLSFSNHALTCSSSTTPGSIFMFLSLGFSLFFDYYDRPGFLICYELPHMHLYFIVLTYRSIILPSLVWRSESPDVGSSVSENCPPTVSTPSTLFCFSLPHIETSSRLKGTQEFSLWS